MKHEQDQRGNMHMKTSDHEQMMDDEHRKILWVHLTNVVLGVWLITSPMTFGYRSMRMSWSDIASGLLLVLFGFLSFNPRRFWAPWASCFVGICWGLLR